MALIVFACPSFVGACMCNQMLLFRRLVFVSDRKPPNASFSQTAAGILSEVESCLLSPPPDYELGMCSCLPEGGRERRGGK